MRKDTYTILTQHPFLMASQVAGDGDGEGFNRDYGRQNSDCLEEYPLFEGEGFTQQTLKQFLSESKKDGLDSNPPILP